MAVDAGAITIRHKSGQRVTFAVTPGTLVSRRDGPAAIADVPVRMRIVVVYHFVDGGAVADEVHLF